MKYNYTAESYKATQDLINAVQEGDLEKARQALAHSANVNCRVHLPTMKIASPDQLKNTQVDEAVPQYGQNDGEVEATDKVAYTVPMADTTTLLNMLARSAASGTQLEMAKLLMDHGAELGAIDYASYWTTWGKKAPNYFQNTPLLNAIACNNLPFAELYMTYLVRLDKTQREEILNYKDKFIAGYHSALEFALRRGYSGLAATIVKAGADVNPQPFIYSYAGGSPLHMACMLLGTSRIRNNKWHPVLGSDLDLVIALIEHGADCYKKTKTVVWRNGSSGSGRFVPHTIELTPLDHLNRYSTQFDYKEACVAPAFKPTKAGQIKHPFYEEECFLSPEAMSGYNSGMRAAYLQSEQFLQEDLPRIYEVSEPCIPGSVKPLAKKENPIFNLALQNRILSCKSNYYESSEEESLICTQASDQEVPQEEPVGCTNTLGSVDNSSSTLTSPRSRGLSAESIDPADKPRDLGVVGIRTILLANQLLQTCAAYLLHLSGETGALAEDKKRIVTEACALLELYVREANNNPDRINVQQLNAKFIEFEAKLQEKDSNNEVILTKSRDTAVTRFFKTIAAIFMALRWGWEESKLRFFGPKSTRGYETLENIQSSIEQHVTATL